MPPKGHGPWQQSAEAQRDRAHVIRMVQRTGEQQLVFTAYDVRATARRYPAAELATSRVLYRHLKVLTPDVVTEVGTEVHALRKGAAGVRHVRRYVLTSRLAEWHEAGGGHTDLEKVLLALWVACAALRVPGVPTIMVTRVLRLIEVLRLHTTQSTSTLLERLAKQAPPAVASTKTAEGGRLWTPIGEVEHPQFSVWIAQVATVLSGDAYLPADAYASRNAATAALVRRSIELSKSAEWPHGRSVTADDLRTTAATDPIARALLTRITAGGKSLGNALHEASRHRRASQQAGDPVLQQLVTPGGHRTRWYDLFGDIHAEGRAQVANLHAARELLTTERLLGMDADRRDARRLAQLHPDPVVQRLVTLRHYAVGLAVEETRALVKHIGEHAEAFGREPREELAGMLETLNGYIGLARLHASVAEQAHRELRGLGAHPLVWPHDIERPLITAPELAAYAPQDAMVDDPATMVARMTTVPRFANPRYTRKQDPDPTRACTLALDRPEALLVAAQRTPSKMVPWLQRGYQLMGRQLRDARVIVPLVDHADAGLRDAGLAALALLGAPDAVVVAQAALEQRNLDVSSVLTSLYTLAVCRTLSADSVPRHIRYHRDRRIALKVDEVLEAVEDGRWLLQVY